MYPCLRYVQQQYSSILRLAVTKFNQLVFPIEAEVHRMIGRLHLTLSYTNKLSHSLFICLWADLSWESQASFERPLPLMVGYLMIIA